MICDTSTMKGGLLPVLVSISLLYVVVGGNFHVCICTDKVYKLIVPEAKSVSLTYQFPSDGNGWYHSLFSVEMSLPIF